MKLLLISRVFFPPLNKCSLDQYKLLFNFGKLILTSVTQFLLGFMGVKVSGVPTGLLPLSWLARGGRASSTQQAHGAFLARPPRRLGEVSLGSRLGVAVAAAFLWPSCPFLVLWPLAVAVVLSCWALAWGARFCRHED